MKEEIIDRHILPYDAMVPDSSWLGITETEVTEDEETKEIQTDQIQGKKLGL